MKTQCFLVRQLYILQGPPFWVFSILYFLCPFLQAIKPGKVNFFVTRKHLWIIDFWWYWVQLQDNIPVFSTLLSRKCTNTSTTWRYAAFLESLLPLENRAYKLPWLQLKKISFGEVCTNRADMYYNFPHTPQIPTWVLKLPQWIGFGFLFKKSCHEITFLWQHSILILQISVTSIKGIPICQSPEKQFQRKFTFYIWKQLDREDKRLCLPFHKQGYYHSHQGL